VFTAGLAESDDMELDRHTVGRQFVFSVVFSLCIFLYCFVCQYQSSDWLWRPPL